MGFLRTLILLAAGGVGLARAQTASTPPGPTFTGSPSNCNKWYVIASGDTCGSVEAKFGITHAQFIAWNPAVSNDCVTNFWLEQAYCVGLGPLVPSTTMTTTQGSTSSTLPGATTPPGPTFTGSPANCNRWYLIVEGDTCTTVEALFGITHTEFLAWNPAVSSNCATNFWLGQAYCVGLGPFVSSTSTTTTSATSSSTSSTPTSTTPYSTRHPVTSQTIERPTYSTDWPPTQTQAGQPSYCNNWHLVTPGQTCNNIMALYGTWMTADDFFAWNPSVGTDCSGLYVYYWLCVGIQPQTSLSLPYQTGNATVELPPYFTWTPTLAPTDPPVFKPTVTAGPLPDNCNAYVQAHSGDTCRSILSTYTFVTQQQFLAWHPFLNGNCDGLLAGYWYCVMAFDWDELPMPPTVTTQPSPVQTGTTGDCRAWYLATGTDDCAFISSIFGTFSPADFVAWNPAVQADCSAIKKDTYYCVGVPGTPTTRSTAVQEPTAAPSERPTQEGIAPGCGTFWLVSRTDTCASIAAHNRISVEDFTAWNPAVGSACSGLEPDFYVCVGLASTSTESSSAGTSTTGRVTSSPSSSSSSSSTSSAPPSSTTSNAAETTPSPIQDGMVAGCKKFYLVQSGDGCWAIANDNAIALSDFYVWNPAVNNGGECVGLWPDVYVCVGI